VFPALGPASIAWLPIHRDNEDVLVALRAVGPPDIALPPAGPKEGPGRTRVATAFSPITTFEPQRRPPLRCTMGPPRHQLRRLGEGPFEPLRWPIPALHGSKNGRAHYDLLPCAPPAANEGGPASVLARPEFSNHTRPPAESFLRAITPGPHRRLG